MDLYEIIEIKYPGINWLNNECIIEIIDGKQEIVEWNRPEPKPLDSELLEWMSDSINISTHKNKIHKELNFPIISQLDDIDLKSIRALRTNDTDRLAELELQAATLREQLLK